MHVAAGHGSDQRKASVVLCMEVKLFHSIHFLVAIIPTYYITYAMHLPELLRSSQLTGHWPTLSYWGKPELAL